MAIENALRRGQTLATFFQARRSTVLRCAMRGQPALQL
jgi:hypothetical protein